MAPAPNRCKSGSRASNYGLNVPQSPGLMFIGVSKTHISEMEHGKRPMGQDLAKRLANALKVNYRVFLCSKFEEN